MGRVVLKWPPDLATVMGVRAHFEEVSQRRCKHPDALKLSNVRASLFAISDGHEPLRASKDLEARFGTTRPKASWTRSSINLRTGLTRGTTLSGEIGCWPMHPSSHSPFTPTDKNWPPNSTCRWGPGSCHQRSPTDRCTCRSLNPDSAVTWNWLKSVGSLKCPWQRTDRRGQEVSKKIRLELAS